MDKFKHTSIITKEVSTAISKLENQNLANISNANELGQIIGYTNEEFFKFAKQADLTGDILQQYKDYTANATQSTSHSPAPAGTQIRIVKFIISHYSSQAPSPVLA